MDRIEVVPVTKERWSDLEALFGEKGAYGGCWCTYWRLKRSEFKAMGRSEKKEALHHLTEAGDVPGLLAYAGEQAVGWISIGPRERYLALENSRILKRVNDQSVWSIVCFFVAKSFRKQGVMGHLLRGAVDYAASQGARIVEGYPIDIHAPLTGYAGYMGLASVFREAGFVEVGRASETQRIMRYEIEG